MYYNDEMLRSIERFLEEKWPRPRTCSVCQRTPDHWRVSETPVLLPLLTGDSDISVESYKKAVESISAAPAIALTCSNCGHIVLFNAAQVGIASIEANGAEGRFIIPSE